MWRVGAPPSRRQADRAFPASAVWSMGFAWSALVAQSMSNGVCDISGLVSKERISIDAPSPCTADLAAGVATDDVIVASDVSPRRVEVAAEGIDDAYLLTGLLIPRGRSNDKNIRHGLRG